MSYGLQVDGANDQTIIDSEPVNTTTGSYGKYLTVSSGPTILSTGFLEWDNTKKFLFLRPGNNQTEIKGILIKSSTTSTNSKFTLYNESGYTVKYFFAEISEDAPEITIPDTTTNQEYGLRVFEADGTTSIFSSTKIAQAINVKGSVEPFGVAGHFDSTNKAEIFSGDVTSNTYVCTGSIINVSATWNLATIIYATSAGKIYYYSYFGGVNSSGINIPAGNFPNASGILIAELKS